MIILPCPAGEIRALMSLYEATNGQHWKKNDGWGTRRPLSEWSGVTVNEEEHVVVLDLGAGRLRGPIPAVLGKLKHLTRLQLLYNKLSGLIPPALGKLKKL
ncbi:unnamed protein product [Chrysoparadoxa australica]